MALTLGMAGQQVAAEEGRAEAAHAARNHAEVVRLLRDLPGRSPRGEELLAFALGECGEPVRAQAMLLPRRASGEIGHLGLLTLAGLALRQGRHAEARAYLAESRPLARTPAEAALTAHALALSAYLGGPRREFPALVAAAVRAAEASGDVVRIAGALWLRHYAHVSAGRVAAAVADLTRARDLFAGLGHAAQTLLTRVDLSDRLMVLGRLGDAEQELEAAGRLARQANPAFLPTLLAMRGDLALWRGSPRTALTFYRAAEQAALDAATPAQALTFALRGVDALRLAGETAAARAALVALGNRLPRASAHVQDACRFLGALLSPVPDPREVRRGQRAELFWASRVPLHLAALELAQGSLSERTAKAVLAHLRRVGSPAVLDVDPAFQPLFGVLAARPDWPRTWPRPGVTVRTLGRLDVQPSLPLQRAAELLVYLALNGPTRRDTLLHDLYSGTGERAAGQLKANLGALRAALGTHSDGPAVTFRDGLYALSPSLRLRLDAHALLAALEGGASPQEALDAYAGPFLPEIPREWAQVWRTRLHDAALNLCERLAAGAPTPHEAATWLRRAIALEPYAAHLHEQLIVILDGQGLAASADAARRAWEAAERELCGGEVGRQADSRL
ncbi:hypothetical protein DAERI_030158 [Deinococcus aerius]|uniref:Bacterial transcriptional activator domain-containing protein n=1 Tax=Deinococcus aerius TaxID=200253 RepID=A0A2I9CTB4_9DEIO|nr:BTAD domain-containing protein [Deinococcus aerius]GBF04992.1 hypothetical protein DAERI_030158 [Deinococcus aerius]